MNRMGRKEGRKFYYPTVLLNRSEMPEIRVVFEKHEIVLIRVHSPKTTVLLE